MDQVGEELAAFVPTDADVESLAVCLFAARGRCSFTEAKRAMQFLSDTERYDYSNLARAAFDHAGYLPSIMAARQDAINAYGHERGIYAAEIAAWKDRCGNLEAQLKVSPCERSDNNLSQPCPYRAYVPGSMPLLETAMAQSADFQRTTKDDAVITRKKIDDWLPTGPNLDISIDSITRLIKVAHEVGDEDLLKLAGQAAKKLLSHSLSSLDVS